MLAANGYKYNAFHALTTSELTTSNKAKKSKHIHFWIKRMGLEYVIHELAHAVLWAATENKMEVQESEDAEELFVQALADSVKLFYKKLHKLGVITELDFIKSREF